MSLSFIFRQSWITSHLLTLSRNFRLQAFGKSLKDLFQTDRTDSLSKKKIIDYVNSKNSPAFTVGEIEAALHKMQEENKIMVVDDNVLLI